MRQIFIGAPLLILLFFVLYMFTPVSSPKILPGRFLPADTVLVVTQHKLEERLTEFAESPLGYAISSIEFNTIADELQVPGISGEQVSSFKKELVDTLNDPLFKIIFGREVTIALFPFTIDPSRDFKEQLLANSLIICRPKHNARLIDVIGSFVTEKNKISEAQYGSHTIKRIPLERDQSLTAVRVEDLFLISLDERHVRRSLDRYDDGEGLLEGAEPYNDYRGRFEDASLFSYLNMKEFDKLITALPSIGEGRYKIPLAEIGKYNGIEQLFFGAWRHEGTILEKVLLRYDEEQLPDASGPFFTGTREGAGTLSRVAQDSILYYWNSHFDLKPVFGYLVARENSHQPGQVPDQQGRIQNVLGLSKEQVETLSANDLTIVSKGIPSNQFVPIPYVMAILRNHDPELMQEAVQALIEHYRIPVRDVSINGVKGLSWGGVLGGGGFQPTVLFVDDYLVLSTNIEQAKEFTGSVSEPNSLLSSEIFQLVDKGLTEPNQSIGFFDCSQITVMFKELISWGGTMIAIKDRAMAQKSKILIDRLINPLLDGLAMYSVIGTRKYTEDNLIIFESTTAIDHEKK